MSEYQHFIPKFILRKWGEYVEPLKDGSKSDADWEKAKKKAQKKAGVNTLVMKNGLADMVLERRNCSTICGLNDMYGDEIEKAFSKVEKRAADIIKEIERNASIADHPEFRRINVEQTACSRLSQTEQNELHKFLFLMLYRSRSFHSRFGTSTTEYGASDRELLLAYMKRKELETPRDVWLDNFRVFLEVPLGPDREVWEQKLMEKAYPEDVKMFVEYVDNYSLHICRPENADDLFILTQNAFGVFEGPMSSSGWTSWHFFCPISPKLLILLRHNDLTPSFEESWARNLHEATVNLNPVIHANPGMVMSWFRDMPVYRSGSPDMFKHFIISSEYVQSINSILLDNASGTTMIIFRNEESLVGALEVFLSSEKRGLKLLVPLREQHNASLTVKASGEQIAKIAVGGHYGYEEYLQGLETVAASLGSNVRLRRTELTSRIALSPRFSEGFVTRYRKLGWDGTDSVWLKDLERATEILTDGVFSDMVQQMRDTVHGTEYALNIFRQRTKSSDRRQVWLSNRLWGAIEHFKIAEKITMLQHLDEVVSDDFWCWGDRIADVCDMFPQDLTSNFLFLTLEVRRAWKRLMSEYPLSGLRPQYHFDLAFSEIGSICNCGMQLVSQQAIAARNSLDARALEQILRRTVDFDLDDDMSTEIQVRVELREHFDGIFKGLHCETKMTLSFVLFRILYPIHPEHGSDQDPSVEPYQISELVTAITSAVFTLDDQLRWYEKKIPMPSRHAKPSMLTLSSFIDASDNACYNLTS